MAIYRPNYPDESKYISYYKYAKYSAVIYNNEVIGIIKIFGTYYEDIDMLCFLALSESSYRSLDEGISFYDVTTVKPDDELSYGGYSAMAVFSKTSDKKGLLSYYNLGFLDDEAQASAQNAHAKNKQLDMTKLSEINYIDSNTEIIYSFDFTPDTEHIIKDGGKYLIQSKDGLYLTYENGKYSLSEYSEELSDKQSFIISASGDYFKISPVDYPQKYLSIQSDDEFSLNLSYFNNYCYSISASSNSNLVMTAKNNKAVFSSYQSGKYDASAQDWYIIPA